MTNDFVCLGTLVKVHSNGVTGKDLRDTNGDVRARNDPNVDRSRVGGTIDTRTFRWSVIVARRPLVMNFWRMAAYNVVRVVVRKPV